MSPEKELQLQAIYPPIFQNTSNLASIKLFGFECGDGWFDLLKGLIEKIRDVCIEQSIEAYEDGCSPEVLQVKEKYGSLRFYMSCCSSAIGDLISAADDKSRETCELCGKSGCMRSQNRWYMVRCDECFKPDCVTT